MLIYFSIPKALYKTNNVLKESIARLRFRIWMGLSDQLDHIFMDLNDGYGVKYNEINKINIPYHLHYLGINKKNKLQTRFHRLLKYFVNIRKT